MNKQIASDRLRIGVLGFGGLGQAAARILAPKQEMLWTAAADKAGFAYHKDGLDVNTCNKIYHDRGSIGYLENYGSLSENSIEELIKTAEYRGINQNCRRRRLFPRLTEFT